MDRWTKWIYADAHKYGIDPRAADAISRGAEWGSRKGTGDAGTSFGPFMLHVGGALPRGKGRKWAESRAGVNYALRAMADAGARGLRGQRAISVIASQFEKPANVPLEIRRAGTFYRSHPGLRQGAQSMGGLAALASHTAAGTIPGKGGIDPRRLSAISALLSSINPEVAPILAQVAASQPAPVQPRTAPVKPRAAAAGATAVGRASGKINELFYDPLGAIKNGQHIGAIGGHDDHVHFSLGGAGAQSRAIQQARRMGLHVGENLDSNVHPVHVSDSFHYRKYNKKSPLRMAADVSGDPRAMAAFFKWVAANH